MLSKIGGDSRDSSKWVGHQDAGDLRLEVGNLLWRKPALNEPVGSGLQIIPADLGAAEQAGLWRRLGPR